MKTLYDILEVSETASKEVIEKAYRVLVKKYHPDVNKTKENTEEVIKQINDAYDILSDDIKRNEYNLKLQQERSNEKVQYEESLKNNIYNQIYNNDGIKKDNILNQNDNQNNNQADNKSKHKITLDDIKAIIIFIIIFIIILIILWIIPNTHTYMLNEYNNNIVMKTIVDIFKGIGEGFYKTMQQILK